MLHLFSLLVADDLLCLVVPFELPARPRAYVDEMA
jgi:hypothetical protein